MQWVVGDVDFIKQVIISIVNNNNMFIRTRSTKQNIKQKSTVQQNHVCITISLG